MSDRTRYQAQALYQETPSASSYRGVDPLTGLPVLIYRFSGRANPALARLDSEYLPRLLAWRDDDSGGLMVVAWSSAFVAAGDQPLDNLQLLDSAQALVDAAAAGVSHGDLHPGRFLIAGDSVVLEGFGVPWQEEGVSPGDDVRAWARSVQQLGHQGDGSLSELLSEIADGPETSPAELMSRLRHVLLKGKAPASTSQPEEPAPEAGAAEPAEDELTLDWDGFERREADDLNFHSHSRIQSALDIELEYEPPAAAVADELPATEEPEPEPLEVADAPDQAAAESDDGVFRPSSTFASERLTAQPPAREPAQPLPAGGSSSYLRKLEAPGPAPLAGRQSGHSRPADFDPGIPAAPERNNRRTIMITVLLVLTAILVALVFYLRRSDLENVPEPLTQSVTYVIDVLVEPSDLPPVNLYVLQSPEASGLRPNTILGTAPRRMALDAAGTWVFEGRFQGRTSEPVTINIPEDRASAVTIVIPPEEPEEE